MAGRWLRRRPADVDGLASRLIGQHLLAVVAAVDAVAEGHPVLEWEHAGRLQQPRQTASGVEHARMRPGRRSGRRAGTAGRIRSRPAPARGARCPR